MGDIFYLKVGELLKEYRLGCNLTQEEVADRLNVSRSCYASWELGRRNMNIDDMFKLCDIFGVDINEFSKQVKKYLYKK